MAGVGTIRRDPLCAEQEAGYQAGLRRAVEAGHAILAGNGSALDAVAAAVVTLGNGELFNAGRGSVFTVTDPGDGRRGNAVLIPSTIDRIHRVARNRSTD